MGMEWNSLCRGRKDWVSNLRVWGRVPCYDVSLPWKRSVELVSGIEQMEQNFLTFEKSGCEMGSLYWNVHRRRYRLVEMIHSSNIFPIFYIYFFNDKQFSRRKSHWGWWLFRIGWKPLYFWIWSEIAETTSPLVRDKLKGLRFAFRKDRALHKCH